MKTRAMMLCGNPASIDYVYTPAQIRQIGELTELIPGVITEDELKTGNFSGVELIFSTWGMPALSAEIIKKHLPDLKAVFYAAGATDAFAPACFDCNIKVISAWQANAVPVAEFCLAQILLALKGYFRNTRELKSTCDWNAGSATAGPGVFGETVALIGSGAVAQKLKELLAPFRVELVIVPTSPEERTESLEDIFARAFVISNHLPNLPDNVGVISRKHFASMRPGAVFINTGRGAQVDENALISVMRERPDLTALLDVTYPEPPAAGSELYKLPNIQISTHIAGSLNDEVHRMSELVIDELNRWLAGEKLLHEVTRSMLTTGK